MKTLVVLGVRSVFSGFFQAWLFMRGSRSESWTSCINPLLMHKSGTKRSLNLKILFVNSARSGQFSSTIGPNWCLRSDLSCL